MAYFPNGTAGDAFESKYCFQCVHDDSESGCTVMFLHLMWNYDAVGQDADKTKAAALNHLIPMDDEGIHPAACSMFYERPPEETQ